MLRAPECSALSATPGAVPEPIRLEPGARIGSYQLIRQLGRGGMGTVFLARDTRLDRPVAIKFLNIQGSEAHARFLAEARVTARCHHDNIVAIYDVGELQYLPFMVLEYLRGQTLGELVGDSPIPAPRALELIIPVVRALARTHAQGVVHCDLKPANIFVTDEGVTKVLDFGIAALLPGSPGDNQPSSPNPPAADEDAEPRARPLNSADQRPSSLLTIVGRSPALEPNDIRGTVPYMSPEQLRGDPLDERADLWAVGIILYQMLLGRHPLGTLTMSALAEMAHGTFEIPSARDRLPELGAIADVIDRCIALDRERRIASARELLEALTNNGSGARELC